MIHLRHRLVRRLAVLPLVALALLATTSAARPEVRSPAPAQDQFAQYLPIVLRPQDTSAGFVPQQHGFAFPNYGNRQNYTNMLPNDVRRMFGDRVCASLDGGVCVLTPAAEQWLQEVNNNMGGGHCEGMAVLSQLFFNSRLPVNQFGAPTTPGLPIDGNEALQREIAYWWATQTLSPVYESYIYGTPAEIVARLQAEFAAGKAGEYVLAVRQAGKGGHAITPYEVKDLGGNQYQILVYDNNFPLESRAVSVDLNTNTWSYNLALNPDSPESLFSGDASTKTMLLKPTSNRLAQFPCAFCEGQQFVQTADGLAQAPALTQIWLDGAADLLITDTAGRRLGYVNGALVNEIPGATVNLVARQDVKPWLDNSEPIYAVPTNVDISISLDGSRLAAAAVSSLTVLGPGYVLEANDVTLQPGQVDVLDVTPSGNLLSYRTTTGETPDLLVGFETSAADYTVVVKGFDLGENGAVNLSLDEAGGTLGIDSIGNAQPVAYDLLIERVGDGAVQVFGTGEDVSITPDDLLYVEYKNWPGNGQPLDLGIDRGADGTIDEVVSLPDVTDLFNE